MLKSKKLLSWVLVLSLIMSLSTVSFASSEKKEDTARISSINKLYDEKAQLLLSDSIDTVKLNEVDSELEEAGVKKLSKDEVIEEFPSIKDDIEKKGLNANNTTTDTVRASIALPTNRNVNWSTYTTTYTYNGTKYEVQKLVAQANGQDSPLKDKGSRSISTDYKWAAGMMNLVKAGAGLIPVVGTMLTFYDGTVGTYSSISRTTEIDGADCVYSWSYVSTAVFSYVRVYGTSNTQALTYVSTKCNAAVGYQIPTFYYKNTSGIYVVTPDIIQGKSSFSITPTGYDSTYNAVYAFTHGSSSAVVPSFSLTGLANKSIYLVYPVIPNGPIDLF